MMPTIAQDGDQVLIDKTKRRGKNVKVGDIVSFKHPIMPYHAIKRVVATPGDFVLAGTPRAKGGPLAGQMIQVRRANPPFPQAYCSLILLSWNSHSF